MEIKNVKQDVNGKDSSKRKYGMRLIDTAIYMALIHWAIGLGMSLFGREFTYEFPIDIWWTLIGLGASLLGITLAERFGINTGSFMNKK